MLIISSAPSSLYHFLEISEFPTFYYFFKARESVLLSQGILSFQESGRVCETNRSCSSALVEMVMGGGNPVPPGPSLPHSPLPRRGSRDPRGSREHSLEITA